MTVMTSYMNTRFPQAAAWRKEARALAKLAGPMALTELAYMATVTTDVVMMGWLGADALAAGSLAGNLYWVVELFAFGLIAATAPILAQHIGARRYRKVRQVVRQGFWLCFLVGIPCVAVVWNAGAILLTLGQDPALSASAGSYLRVMVIGFIPGLFYLVFSEFLAAHTRPRPMMVIAIGGICLNALSNYCLMFGNFGFPRLELVGAGISTAIVVFTMTFAIGAYVLTDRKFRRYKLWGRWWRADWPQLAEIIRVGFPIALVEISEMAMFFVAALLMGLISTDALAAHAIVAQTCGVVLMIPMGISQAVTVRVGLETGAGHSAAAARAGWLAMALAGVLMILPAGIFLFQGDSIVGLYMDVSLSENQMAAQLSPAFLAVAAFFLMSDALQLNARGALRGLKDTRGPMVIALISYWGVGMTSAAYFGVYLKLGGEAIWMCLAVAWFLVAMLLSFRFRHQTSIQSSAAQSEAGIP